MTHEARPNREVEQAAPTAPEKRLCPGHDAVQGLPASLDSESPSARQLRPEITTEYACASTVIGCGYTFRVSVGASGQGPAGVNARGAPRRIRQQPQGGNHEEHKHDGNAQEDCGGSAGGEARRERAAEPHPRRDCAPRSGTLPPVRLPSGPRQGVLARSRAPASVRTQDVTCSATSIARKTRRTRAGAAC